MIDDTSTLPVSVDTAPRRVSTVAELASIPEEEIWLQKQKSARTRRAYRLDVQHFMRTLDITTPAELRQADHKAVIAWERYMRETEHAAASTIRRRLAALSSLGCAIGPSCRSACRSVCAVPRLRLSRSANCTRTAATIDCGCRAGAADATRSRSTPKPRRGCAPMSRRPGTWPMSTDRCFGRSSTMVSSSTSAGIWTPMRSIPLCTDTRPCSGSIAATRRTRYAQLSSPRRWRTVRRSKTCRRLLGTTTRAPPSSMTGEGTTRKRQRHFSRRINIGGTRGEIC